jgi:hypothetical protein
MTELKHARVDAHMMDRLRAMAALCRVPVTALLREAVEEYLHRHDRPTAEQVNAARLKTRRTRIDEQTSHIGFAARERIKKYMEE